MLLLSLRKQYLGMTKYHLAAFFAAIYLAIAIFEFILEPFYIFFSDEGENLIIRYFSTGYFNKKKQVIQIPKKSFTGYDIETSVFGLKKKLVLKQRFKSGEAKYHAISISLMNKNQQEMLVTSLDKFKVS